MAEHTHDHEHDADGLGLLIGFRIFEDEGEMYLAEAEIGPYVDDSNALGVTLVFHPLSDLDPTSDEGDEDRPAYPFDFDDELTRDEKAPMASQAQDILRQLARLPEESLREYLRVAREEYGIDDEEEGEAEG
jgi:hypothetical protein